MAKPWFLELLEEHDPEFARLFAGDRDFIYQEGAIPIKYKLLTALVVDALLNHTDGVASLAQQARSRGASEEEIREAVRLAFDCGGTPALIAALGAYRS
ncbi:MAG TPA: carboxymuconolactone decarboxylase family protein [Anaerolineae bacterium]